MNRALAKLAPVRFQAIVATMVLASTSPAWAQAVLTEYTWDTTKTGNQLWLPPANWTPAGGPPNGPLNTANLSRPLGANLNVNVEGGVIVAGLTLGATAAPRTTEISSSSGAPLTFRNDEMPPTITGNADYNGNSFVAGNDFLVWQRGLGMTAQENNNNGDGNADTIVNADDLQVWKDQYGRGSEKFAVGAAFVNSVGVAGSVHTISTGIHLDNEQVEFGGTTNLTVNGPITYIGDVSGPSAAALRVVDPNIVVTMNGNLEFANNDTLEGNDFSINDVERSQGRLIFNGVLSGTGDISIGTQSNGARLPLGTVELNNANTYSGSFRAGRGNLVLGNNSALGTGTYRQAGPANQFGYNLISTADNRVISNRMVVAQWQTVKGDFSLEWAGEISQTNNRGVVNNITTTGNKELKLSGRINIFEEAEPNLVRRFEIHGTGKTRITGSIRDLPDTAVNAPQDHRLVKHGEGVLIVDVAAGNNNHIGNDEIFMGNWHYAGNNSLNVGGGKIRAYGGAIGVDTGVANNAAFLNLITINSTGGLQLAQSDANATLDFTTGPLANAANMTVAAPETNLQFTGTIIPHAAVPKYQLGGGKGTLTLPGAQLSGARSVEVRNGGTVELLGDNTYTGSTTILTKFTSTFDAVAAADSSASNLSVGTNYFSQVAPTLVVDKLSNGGVASSIGAALSAASNLFIHGSTLKYTGTGDSTDRLFTVGTGGATIDASGAGALVFSNTGALAMDEADDRDGSLDDFTGTRDPFGIYDIKVPNPLDPTNPDRNVWVSNTADIMPGMTVTDPDADPVLGPPPFGPPLIPADTRVTGIDDEGVTLGIDKSYGFHLKADTRIVFGTVPRTLTLSGGNPANNNTLAAAITNSSKGGVVNISKTGTGRWILSGANTYTGTTTVSAGTLLVNGVHTGGGAYTVASGATLGGNGTAGGNVTVNGTLAPGSAGVGAFAVTGNVTFNPAGVALFEIGGTTAGTQHDKLTVSGTLVAGGVFDIDLVNSYVPAINDQFTLLAFGSASGAFTFGPGSLPPLPSGRAWNTSTLLTTGIVRVVASSATAVPEPGAFALAACGVVALLARRRRPA